MYNIENIVQMDVMVRIKTFFLAINFSKSIRFNSSSAGEAKPWVCSGWTVDCRFFSVMIRLRVRIVNKQASFQLVDVQETPWECYYTTYSMISTKNSLNGFDSEW